MIYGGCVNIIVASHYRYSIALYGTQMTVLYRTFV